MTVERINRALERCLNRKSNYAELVHELIDLDCSDPLIEAIIVGAMGEAVRGRIEPIINVLRGYDDLSSTDQIDVLYSIVNRQEINTQAQPARKKKIA